ncbi:hypothetical protein F441_08964 [Phytophthora nicotianae CJ01A1]|uniref:Uncharacterized protein n=1 Tax=Phytophthora nicotianae CJ01A1 TaxID=1317063 RepID=W2X0X4_PHYNI|nr:hypothetical protein F441_08964 [Phytophthora nicotianae CJ01A1]
MQSSERQDHRTATFLESLSSPPLPSSSSASSSLFSSPSSSPFSSASSSSPPAGVQVPTVEDDHWTYWNVSQWIKIQTDMACVPSMGLGDFEQALHLEIRDQFESACIVGYLFYWKQAIRRKMISLGIARVEVAAAMESGVLDLFTVLPVNVLQKKGIPFVIKTLYRLIVPTEADRKEKWQAFWDYFVKTW